MDKEYLVILKVQSDKTLKEVEESIGAGIFDNSIKDFEVSMVKETI